MTYREKRLGIIVLSAILVLAGTAASVLIYQAAPWLRPELKTARNNSMQYYVSLPRDWTPSKTWPIVVTVDGANKDFRGNSKRFMRARGNLPFILVTPLVVSNGADTNHRLYNYSDAVWQQVMELGVAQFDYNGLEAVLNDVRQDYDGQNKFFMGAWSAGGHLTWQMIFTHPEQLAGAALAASDYAGRGVTTISTDPARTHLPIKAFQGDADIYLTSLNKEWALALRTASDNGYQNILRVTLPGQGHSPFPSQVLSFFNSVYTTEK